MGQPRRVGVLLVLLAGSVVPASLAQSPTQPGGGSDALVRIRPTGPRAAVTLSRGLRLCPTIRALVEQLDRSDLIVYVICERRPPGRSDASIQLVHATAEFRFVQIAINIERALPQRLALLAHELQHALEVAGNPGIRDRASFLQYYEQIGIRHLDPKALDTDAARQTGERVRQELARVGVVR